MVWRCVQQGTAEGALRGVPDLAHELSPPVEQHLLEGAQVCHHLYVQKLGHSVGCVLSGWHWNMEVGKNVHECCDETVLTTPWGRAHLQAIGLQICGGDITDHPEADTHGKRGGGGATSLANFLSFMAANHSLNLAISVCCCKCPCLVYSPEGVTGTSGSQEQVPFH